MRLEGATADTPEEWTSLTSEAPPAARAEMWHVMLPRFAFVTPPDPNPTVEALPSIIWIVPLRKYENEWGYLLTEDANAGD